MKTHGTTIQRGVSLLAILACAAFFASGRAAEPLRVRVLTYNIHHGEGTDGKKIVHVTITIRGQRLE